MNHTSKRPGVDRLPPVVLACVLILHVPAAGQEPVAMFRGGPSHPGVYAPAGSTYVGLQWTFRTPGDVIGSPTVADDVVYVASGDGGLYAIDLLTGVERWRRELGAPSHSTPAVAGSLVYAVTRDGRIQAVDRDTGRRVWEVATGPDVPLAWGHESGDIYTSSPTLSGDLLVVGSGDGYVYALDRKTGEVRWRARTGGRVRSSPAIADGRVYVGSMDGILYAYDLETGQAAWRFETKGAGLFSGDFGFDRRTIQSSPSVADGVVYVGSRDGTVYAVDARDGSPRWTLSHGTSWVITSPAVTDGTVYAGSSDAAFVQAIDAGTGQERWRQSTAGIVWSSPAASGGLLVVCDGVGIVSALDRATGQLRWRAYVPGGTRSSPVVTDGLVVVGTNDGGVYALRTGDVAPVQRVVFFDSTYVRAAWNRNAGQVATSLEQLGYEKLDESSLTAFLERRLDDHAPSVVAFAMDYLPAAFSGNDGRDALLRRYLDAGGKVVWPGVPPLMWQRDPATGKSPQYNEVDWSKPARLLGVDFDRAIFDRRGTHVTAAGRRWGLADRGRLAWGVAPDAVSEVLTLDEWGLAAEWNQSYGGASGTGFVLLGTADPVAMYLAAEYRPTGPAVEASHAR